MRLRQCLSILLFAGLAVLAPRLAPAAEVEVGFIESYAPEGAALDIQRDGKAVPVRLCGRVLAGDVIHLTRPDQRVVLRLMDRDDPVVITSARGEYRVATEAPKRNFLSGAWDTILDALNVLDGPERKIVSASIRGSGDELSVALLAVPQTLIAGRRPLTLGWLPEELPVTIRISAASGGKPVIEQRGLGGLWTSPPLDLKPGDYTVEVFPRAGKAVIGKVRVATASALPALPPELASAEAPADMRGLGQAAWLAFKEKPAWRLEALQRVAPFASAFAPADRLTWTLVEGGKLK